MTFTKFSGLTTNSLSTIYPQGEADSGYQLNICIAISDLVGITVYTNVTVTVQPSYILTVDTNSTLIWNIIYSAQIAKDPSMLAELVTVLLTQLDVCCCNEVGCDAMRVQVSEDAANVHFIL